MKTKKQEIQRSIPKSELIAELGVWQPIETVPKRNKAVLLWHTVWECPVAAKYKKGNWLEMTLTTLWPTNAFSHWMPIPPAPPESP